MYNFLESIISRLKILEKEQVSIKCATVTSVSPFKCQFDGESNSLTYPKPSIYTPTLNDRVYFICADGKYVCLGKYE